MAAAATLLAARRDVRAGNPDAGNRTDAMPRAGSGEMMADKTPLVPFTHALALSPPVSGLVERRPGDPDGRDGSLLTV